MDVKESSTTKLRPVAGYIASQPIPSHLCNAPSQEICARAPGVASSAHIDTSELPLQAAARSNSAAAVRALVAAGANLEVRDPSTGRTALKVGHCERLLTRLDLQDWTGAGTTPRMVVLPLRI